jgi:hypothetical protein
MKLYLQNTTITNNFMDDIQKYKCNETFITSLWSNEGIFEIVDNNIYKLIPNDANIEHFTCGKNKYLVDKSYFKKYKIYQLPFTHEKDEYTRITYKLHAKSKLTLIIEYNQKIKNIYFTTDENLDNNFIHEDLHTFLSYLK